jgi:uncharacterized phage protein (TIGR02220 family)
MNETWIKLYRKLLQSPLWNEPLLLRAFLLLLLSANYQSRKVYIRNLKSEVVVGEGELITSYAAWAEGIRHKEPKRGNPWKTPTTQEMRTILKHLENAKMVTRLPTGGCLHLRIVNWEFYQSRHNKATGVPTEVQQRSNREQEVKKGRSNAYGIEIKEIIDHLNNLTGSNYKPTTGKTVKLISGRLSGGHTVEDCKLVVSHRVEKWMDDPKMREFLRPNTLFRPSNFENYLQEARRSSSEKDWPEMPDAG